MIHIVFQPNDAAVLQEAIGLDIQLTGEIVTIVDDFAVGPISDSFTPEGMETRKQWWREVTVGGDYDGIVDDGSVADDHQTVQKLSDKLVTDSAETIWIWVAQNKHDVSGYYWLISQLKDFQGRVFILSLNNLPFINLKGSIFYPAYLFEIPAREFLKAKKLARLVTAAEFEIDPEEWIRLCNENKGVRLLEGAKKLQQHGYDFFDPELKKFLTGDWIKASKLIHQFLVKAAHTTGDAYLLWRLKQIIASQQIEVQGELKNMKDFEVKTKTQQTVLDQ